VFWNAFPCHPYNPKKGILSNRTPSDDEFEKGVVVMKELFELFRGIKAIAVGKKAKAQLRKLGIDAPEVRHPANGGATKFREQIMKEIK
jgi:hypothetical protein